MNRISRVLYVLLFQFLTDVFIMSLPMKILGQRPFIDYLSDLLASRTWEFNEKFPLLACHVNLQGV